MNTIKILLAACLVSLTLSSSVWATPGVMDILKKMEEIEFIGGDAIVKMAFTVQRKNEGVRVLESLFYRRDADDAFLMVMTDPSNEKGNGYLRTGENMWMYRRNARTFQKLSRYERVAGTDSRATDFEKRKYTELYEAVLDKHGREMLREETLGKAKIPVYRIEVNAIVKDIEFPKAVYWVKQDDFLPMKSEQYSLSGTHMVTSYFPKYMTVNGKYLPAKIIVIDEFEKGNKTILELTNASLESIDNDVFTKAYLESLSK